MKIMERLIQKVDRSSWAKKLAIEKRYEPIEARLGFPHHAGTGLILDPTTPTRV